MSNRQSTIDNRQCASVPEIRAAFPALRRRHNGSEVAYFDGPGGTQVPEAVGRAVLDYLYHHNANTHWGYPTSEETDRLLLDARAAFADFLFCRAEQVVFGQNMTTLTFHLARGLGRRFDRGDIIVVTDLDHHANRAPWEALVAERGVTLRVVPFDPAGGELEWEVLERALDGSVRLLAIGSASNALGTINDVVRICRLARDRGVLTFVDAVHSAAHQLVDVKAIGCDFLACSPYKFYGPHCGVLWGRGVLLEEVPVPKLVPAPDDVPERLETGTLSHEAIVGSAAAVDFLAGLSPGGGSRRDALVRTFHELEQRAATLLRHLWVELRALPGVTLFGPPPGRPRTPTLSFVLDGYSSESVARHLARRGVFVSHGDFYAATVVERLKVEGLVRAGCSCYTTEDEVDRLIAGVAEIAKG